jgi:hypothetical protein
MSISEHFRYRNDSFQSDIFVSDIGITDVDVRCRILPTLRSMSMPTYGSNHLEPTFYSSCSCKFCLIFLYIKIYMLLRPFSYYMIIKEGCIFGVCLLSRRPIKRPQGRSDLVNFKHWCVAQWGGGYVSHLYREGGITAALPDCEHFR